MNIDKVYGKDCAAISDKIYKKTNRQVSATTLKRFFGLIKSEFKPSKYTLDSLSEFVGFTDWHDFLNSFDDMRYPTSKYDSWVLLKMRIMQVTDYCLDSLKQRTHYQSQKFLSRLCVSERFHGFKKSNARATMFVAPDGNGKSVAMLHLAEHILSNKEGDFENDIVCLIDGGIFFNLYSQNHNIELLNQLIDFKIQSSLSVYFQQNPEKRKGRLWLLIDGIDEIFFDTERYLHTVENLMRILMAHNNNWFKVILSCRPENLEAFTLALNKNPILKKFWYDVRFFEDKSINAINIPPYNHNEIKLLLELNNVSKAYEKIFTSHRDVLEIIAHPFSMSLFVGAFKQNEPVSEIILLDRYINTKIFSPPYVEEKLRLTNRYFKLCNFGKNTNSVKKELLLTQKNEVPAYRELISNGVLFEFIVPEDTITQKKYVSFAQEIVFDYLLLRAWSNKIPNATELFANIISYYNCTKSIQCTLLKIFIKKLIHDNNIDGLKSIKEKFGQTMPCKRQSDNLNNCVCVVRSAIDDAIENSQGHSDLLLP